jgi:hypothetical protein
MEKHSGFHPQNVEVKTKWLERRQERVLSIEENSKPEAIAEKILPDAREPPAKYSGSSKCKSTTRKDSKSESWVTRIIGDPKQCFSWQWVVTEN